MLARDHKDGQIARTAGQVFPERRLDAIAVAQQKRPGQVAGEGQLARGVLRASAEERTRTSTG
ncbi:MAG: hypothetical protein DWQ31_12715 [Planctomycetota bacterium]|nr:MAG: hypothetical protein DWQ31_12715 [Planctomycetota bacterium]REJ95663.1 MAG: hypothetical protein DWQ35_06105 [Planctomycetota bacterium]REK29174.1 MAG: hypothetical protein DWQ42_03935 [Planctomycetota bacterium]REK46964.1 MAG: hypothetical protein DWQ46_05585 [Planctomycetota bacterium]